MFGFAASLFFVSYFLVEIPSNLALQKFGARRWISRIMISWGLVTACMAFVVGPYSLYALRFVLRRGRSRLLSRRDSLFDILAALAVPCTDSRDLYSIYPSRNFHWLAFIGVAVATG